MTNITKFQNEMKKQAFNFWKKKNVIYYSHGMTNTWFQTSEKVLMSWIETAIIK